MKRVGIYIRVSTADQNPQVQRDELPEYAKARGWKVVEIYEDRRTGTNDKRAGLQKLLADVHERKLDVVLCYKLDRMFRSFREMVNLLHTFSELGVQFVSLKDPGVGGTSASEKLLTHLLSCFAEFEASLIRERVRAGVQAKIRRTGKWGREKTVDDAKVKALRDEGRSVREIAKVLKVSKSTVQRSLSRGVPNTPKNLPPKT